MRSPLRLRRAMRLPLVAVVVLAGVLALSMGEANAAPRPLSITSVVPTWRVGRGGNQVGFTARWRVPSASVLPGANLTGAIAVPMGSSPITDPLAFIMNPNGGSSYYSSYALCLAGSVSYDSTCDLFGSGPYSLNPVTNYTVYVFAIATGSGQFTMVASSVATTPEPRPYAPRSVQASAVADGTAVEVTWAPGMVIGDAPAPSFAVRVTRSGDPGSTLATCSASVDRRRCRIGGLPADDSYRVVVSATNAFGTTSADPVTVSLRPTAPASVDVAAGATHTTTSTDRVIEATWPLSVSEGRVPAISYSAAVTRADDPDGPVVTACDAAPNLTRCRFTGLEPATAYVVTVVAANAVSSSSIRSEPVTTPATVVPATPTGITTSTTPEIIRYRSDGRMLITSPTITVRWLASANRASTPTLDYYVLALPIGVSLPTDTASMVSLIEGRDLESFTSYAICVGSGGGAHLSCRLQGSGAHELRTVSTYAVFLVAGHGMNLSPLAGPILVSTAGTVVRYTS